MTNEQIEEKLIEAGVKNLKEFGYPKVTKDSILTDLVYAQFFKSMLLDNVGKLNSQTDEVIYKLMNLIDGE